MTTPSFRDSVELLIRSAGLKRGRLGRRMNFSRVKCPIARCLVLDVICQMSGLELQQELGKRGVFAPIIFIRAKATSR